MTKFHHLMTRYLAIERRHGTQVLTVALVFAAIFIAWRYGSVRGTPRVLFAAQGGGLMALRLADQEGPVYGSTPPRTWEATGTSVIGGERPVTFIVCAKPPVDPLPSVVSRFDVKGSATFSVDGQIRGVSILQLSAQPQPRVIIVVDQPRTVTVALGSGSSISNAIGAVSSPPAGRTGDGCASVSVQNDGSIPKDEKSEAGVKAGIVSDGTTSLDLVNVPSFFLVATSGQASIGSQQQTIGITTNVTVIGWSTISIIDSRILTDTKSTSTVTFNGIEQRPRRWAFLEDVPAYATSAFVAGFVGLAIGLVAPLLLGRAPKRKG
jgi:hypothetical protein